MLLQVLSVAIVLLCLGPTNSPALAATTRFSIVSVGGSALVDDSDLQQYQKSLATQPTDFGLFDAALEGSVTHSVTGGSSSSQAQQSSTLIVDAAGNLVSLQGSGSAHAKPPNPITCLPTPVRYPTGAVQSEWTSISKSPVQGMSTL